MVPVHTWLPDAATEARPGDRRPARRRARQGRHLRDDPVLPAAVPRGQQVGHAGRHRAGGDLRALRRAARDRPDRHHATDRLHLDQPLRLHRARHLRHDDDRVRRVDALHGQPRLHHGRAVPLRRDARHGAGASGSPTSAAGSGSPRCSPGRCSSPACPVWPCPGSERSSPSSSSWSGTFQRYPVAAVIATVGIILAALYILLMYKRMVTGPAPESAAGTLDLGGRERWVVGAAHRPVPRPRLLPQAGARRHQPGGLDDAAPHGGHRPRTGRPGERPARRRRHEVSTPARHRRLHPGHHRLRRAAAHARRLRVRPGRRARRGVRPAWSRYVVQVAVTLVGLVVAFLAVVLVAVNHQIATAGLLPRRPRRRWRIKGSVVIDGPALFLQGAVLVLSFLGVLTMAERLGGVGVRRVHPDRVAPTPGSPQEAHAVRAGAPPPRSSRWRCSRSAA